MTKVSIVGVEGSGKTVLMAVLGDKYKRPDAKGLSLKPNNFTTLAFVESAMEDLRSGTWPSATAPQNMKAISWTLQQKTGKDVKAICEVPMLDFAGEIYRLAFGDHTADEIAPYEGEVKALREHVATSTCLIVLVNLSHVINGSMKDSRTLETIWLTQRIVDFAREHKVANIAIGLSQFDRYKDEVKECGGIRAAIEKHLPYIATSYGELQVLAVSSVGRVIPDANGHARPAANATAFGCGKLMDWVFASATNRKAGGASNGFGSDTSSRVQSFSPSSQKKEANPPPSPPPPQIKSVPKPVSTGSNNDSKGCLYALGVMASAFGFWGIFFPMMEWARAGDVVLTLLLLTIIYVLAGVVFVRKIKKLRVFLPLFGWFWSFSGVIASIGMAMEYSPAFMILTSFCVAVGVVSLCWGRKLAGV